MILIFLGKGGKDPPLFVIRSRQFTSCPGDELVSPRRITGGAEGAGDADVAGQSGGTALIKPFSHCHEGPAVHSCLQHGQGQFVVKGGPAVRADCLFNDRQGPFDGCSVETDQQQTAGDPAFFHPVEFPADAAAQGVHLRRATLFFQQGNDRCKFATCTNPAAQLSLGGRRQGRIEQKQGRWTVVIFTCNPNPLHGKVSRLPGNQAEKVGETVAVLLLFAVRHRFRTPCCPASPGRRRRRERAAPDRAPPAPCRAR